MIGLAWDAQVAELLAVNALLRLRHAQGVLRLAQRHGDGRLEVAARRAIEVGDAAYRTVKGSSRQRPRSRRSSRPGPGSTRRPGGAVALDLDTDR